MEPMVQSVLTIQPEAGPSHFRGREAPRVSVCMPASRNTPWFRQALRSAMAQSLSDIEIVITDDSGGDLAGVAESFGDSRIRYFSNPTRLGFAGNHCRCLDLATGEYVALLHDDDAWEAEYLSTAAAVLDRNPEVGMVLCGAMEIDGHDLALGVRPARMEPGIQADPLGHFLLPEFMMMLPSLALFRRGALETNSRPWPDVNAADVTLFIDVARSNWKVFYVEKPLVRYRIHDHQISTDDFAHRHALVTVWSGYTFSEERFESQRRKCLAKSLIGRAGALLRRRDYRGARRDLAEAQRTSPETARRLRWWLLRAVATAPFLAGPLVRLRNALPRQSRHQGF
jgi:glycosyltransferase involved in cell wall biosynthesis